MKRVLGSVALVAGICLVLAITTAWRLNVWEWPPRAQAEATKRVWAMRVVGDGSEVTGVIVPAQSLIQEQERTYVLVVDGEEATRVEVLAQPWRAPYWRVDGLARDSIVILDNRVTAGQVVKFQLINPEAGQSGLIEADAT